MARAENEEFLVLRSRLEEVEETLQAIRSGAVDALVVSGPGGERVFTLQGAHRPYRLLVENLEEGAATLNEKGMILYCNRRFAEMLRSPIEQVIGAQIESFLEFASDAVRLLKGGTVVRNQEFRLRAADGSCFPACVSVGRLDIEEVRGSVLAVTDLSGWKKLEHELFQAQKLESLGRLASGIAHDFNNILGIICGYVYFLENNRDTEESREGIGGIKRMVERGGKLVQQLLSYARKPSADFKPFEIQATIRELAQMLTQTFPKEIEISLKTLSELPVLYGDPNEIYQALLNLAVNARDAMPRGGRLEFATNLIEGTDLSGRVPEAKEARYVCVSVKDTGFGMSQSVRSSIFEPFFSTKTGERKSGFGLAVVHGIVKSHGGFIEVESEEGRGTVFRLYFPVKEEEPVLPGLSEFLQVEEESSGRGGTILYVEDEEVQLGLMKKVLERSGYAVLEAKDGLQAIELFREHKDKVSLVVLDLGLPTLSGAETLSGLKKEDPGVKVILTSGYLDPGSRAELLQETAVDFLQKPYPPTDMVRLIDRVLSGEKAAAVNE